MRHYRATTAIHATPEAIWRILTDAGNYPRWDQTMDRIEGRLALGETVKFFTKLSPSAFPVKVTVFEPQNSIVLSGGMPFGLFKSERTHTLTPIEGGMTTFTTEEMFGGLLLPLFSRSIPDLTEYFQGFVTALKRQAEQ